MSDTHWYAFYPGDYAKDTAHLSLAEDGAYRRLLDYCYATGKPIPTHVEQVFRICRAFAPEEQQATRLVLAQFFVEQPDGFRNARVERELLKRNGIRTLRVKAGRASAEARKQTVPTHVGTDVGTNSEHVLTQPQPQPHKTKSFSSEQKGCSDPAQSPNKKESTPEAVRLSTLLAELIRANNPNARTYQNKWGAVADLMIRVDERAPQEIERCIRWAQQDTFWRKNALSMDAIREHFDRFILEIRGTPAAVTGGVPADYVPASARIRKEQTREDSR